MRHLSKITGIGLLLLSMIISMGFVTISDPEVDAKSTEAAALGIWISNNGNEKFEIFKKEDKYYGKIIWTNHQERLGYELFDTKNPDPAKRNQPVVGLEILRDFVYKGNGVYTHGRVYDPGSGKTYKCKIKAEGNTAKVRGYILMPLLGRTETAHRVID